MKLVWADSALRDVDDILRYIRPRSPSGARNVAISINRAGASCAELPFAGSKTRRSKVWRWPLTDRRMTIFYRVDVDNDTVEIIRVVRSGRVKNLRRLPDEN